MIKVLVCDYIGNAQKWLDNFTIKKNYEVIGTISPVSDKDLLLEKSWDYLLIFEQGTRQFFESMIKFMKIADEQVIYALNIKSWLEHPAAVLSLVNPERGGAIYRYLSFDLERQINHFATCTTSEGFNYIATSKDDYIIRTMYIGKKNHAEDEMKFFHKLVEKFYHVDDNSGLFLDLGANIGTTGIYFTKKIAPKLKLLAFEPDPENFKLLRLNLILNDIEDKTVVENLGLGIEESIQTIYRDTANPGHNGMFSKQGNNDSANIKIVSLDKYFSEKNLSAEAIKYIWIDTEGFEPQVLLGAQNILRQNPAPIFMEFNPQWWQKSGYYEKMMEFLKPVYSSYVWALESMRSGNISVHPIEKLWEFQDSKADFGSIGDIFLIRKN